jgi:hypothetical protein
MYVTPSPCPAVELVAWLGIAHRCFDTYPGSLFKFKFTFYFAKVLQARRAADQQACFTESFNDPIIVMARFRLCSQTAPRASQRKPHQALNAPIHREKILPCAPILLACYCMGKPSSMNNVRSFSAVHVRADHIESITKCTIMKCT